MLKKLFLFFVLFLFPLKSFAETELVLPSCTENGEVICKEGYIPHCLNLENENSEPKCIFIGTKYMPGCYKYIRDEKINFELNAGNSSFMGMAVGDGKVYTLDLQAIRCKKL